MATEPNSSIRYLARRYLDRLNREEENNTFGRDPKL
jgi:hypothetical protein